MRPKFTWAAWVASNPSHKSFRTYHKVDLAPFHIETELSKRGYWNIAELKEIERPGPVFCLLLGVSSDYAQPITGQVTDVTCPVIGRAQPELTPSRPKR